MKKFALVLSFLLIPLLLFGCNNNSADNASGVDMDLVGAWQIADGSQPEYYIFAEDGGVKVQRGTVSFEGEAVFEVNADGTRTYTSNFYYMAGILSYSFNGDTVTFDDGAGTVQTLKKAQYNAPELKKYEDFNSENPLVGTWSNEEYNDSYIFNSDGTATYTMDFGELEYISRIDYTYSVKDGTVYFTYDAGSGSQELTSVFEIDGDTLVFDGSAEYTRQ